MALVRGSLDALRPGVRFARVVANLDRVTLELVLTDLAARVTPGGRLGVAGVLAGEEGGIVALARDAGLEVVDQRVDPDPTANGAWWSGWLKRAILIPS